MGSPRRSLTPRRRPAGRATAHRRPHVTPRSRRRSHSAPPAGLDSARAALERSLALPHPAAEDSAAAAACVSVDSADDSEDITLDEPPTPALPPDPVLAPVDAAGPDTEGSKGPAAAAWPSAAEDASGHSPEPAADAAPAPRGTGSGSCQQPAVEEGASLLPDESARAGGGAVRRVSSAQDLRESAHEQRQRSGVPPATPRACIQKLIHALAAAGGCALLRA